MSGEAQNHLTYSAFININQEITPFPFIGLQKIKAWTQEALKTRLRKSLSHDWIHETTSHKFPLREYYVQLEWEKKIRTAIGSKTVTLTSIYELTKHLGFSKTDAKGLGAAAIPRRLTGHHVTNDAYDSGLDEDDDDSQETCSSVVIEGLY